MQRPWDQQQHSFAPRWNGGSRRLLPWLIGVNIAVFIIQKIMQGIAPGVMEVYLGLSFAGLSEGFWWQPVTYMFLHGNAFHLLANLLIIYFAGRQVESLIGTKRFAVVYALGGIFGGLAQTLLTGGLIVGASAAGMAVLLVFTTILPELELTLLLFFIIPVRMKARHLAYAAVAVSLLFTIFPPGDNVGHLAHLIGCITGWAYARWLGYGQPLPVQMRVSAPKPPRAESLPELTPEEFISREIDPILDKIAREGIHSLTRSERRILDRGRAEIERKTARRG